MKYFKLEDLRNDITPLEDYLDIEIVNIQHINKANERRERRTQYINFKYPPIKQYKKYYDEETENIVRELYDDDIKKFGYTYPF